MDQQTHLSVYKASRAIKQESDTVLHNRLKSIQKDRQFVDLVKRCHPPHFKLFANLRCGAWYHPYFDATCYFKSTDGHYGQWQFNLSRLNLHVANQASQDGGLIIVDSTRKGKRYPDSFSRTIPIWCCVINRCIQEIRKSKRSSGGSGSGGECEWDAELHMPLWVSLSEHSQVQQLIDGYVKKLLFSGADLLKLAAVMHKPLRCLWVSPASRIWENEQPEYHSLPFYPIVCVSASEAVGFDSDSNSSTTTTETIDKNYIQGAGDDEESWARGMTPSMFWENELSIMSDNYEGLEARLDTVVAQSKLTKITIPSSTDNSNNNNNNNNSNDSNSNVSSNSNGSNSSDNSAELKKLFVSIADTGLSIGWGMQGLSSSLFSAFPAVLNCSALDYEGLSQHAEPGHYKYAMIPEGKSDKNKLSKVLPEALSFIHSHLQRNNHVLIHCYSGMDNAVCVCLCALLKYFDTSGKLLSKPRTKFSKDTIRAMLLFIEQQCSTQATMTWVAPPRVMMNEVNRFFMTPPDLQSKALLHYQQQQQQPQQQQQQLQQQRT